MILPFNPFSGLTSKIYGGVAIAALTFGAVQTVRIEGFLFIHGYKGDLAARDKTIAQMQLASDQARTAQLAVNKAAEDKSRQIAKDNSNVETQIRTIYVDRRDAYADRMRFDKVCRSSAGSPAQDGASQVDHGPGADSIIVSRADFDILVENTGRLDAVHQWGEAQIAAGLAVGE